MTHLERQQQLDELLRRMTAPLGDRENITTQFVALLSIVLDINEQLGTHGNEEL